MSNTTEQQDKMTEEVLSFEECIQHANVFGYQKNILLGAGFIAPINKFLMYNSIRASICFPFRQHIEKDSPNLEKTMEILNKNPTTFYGHLLKPSHLKDFTIKHMIQYHFKRFIELDEAKILSCHKFLSHFSIIFTTNFDLYLYTVQIHPKLKKYYRDGFYNRRDRDGKRKFVWNIATKTSKKTTVYYLHGALHLFYDEDTKKKKVYSLFPNEILIDDYDRSYCTKITALINRSVVTMISTKLQCNIEPIVVFNRNSDLKYAQILYHPYLNTAFKKLGSIDRENLQSLFIFGHSLDETVDLHIITQISSNRFIKNIYYGIYDFNNTKEKCRIKKLLVGNSPYHSDRNLYFFNTREMDIWETQKINDMFQNIQFSQ